MALIEWERLLEKLDLNIAETLTLKYSINAMAKSTGESPLEIINLLLKITSPFKENDKCNK